MYQGKRFLKRSLAMLLAVLMLCTAVPVQAFATEANITEPEANTEILPEDMEAVQEPQETPEEPENTEIPEESEEPIVSEEPATSEETVVGDFPEPESAEPETDAADETDSENAMTVAAEPEQIEPETESYVYINPLYADVTTEEDILALEESSAAPRRAARAATPTYYTTQDEVALDIRAGMENRAESIVVYYKAVGEAVSSNFTRQAFARAVENTGVPTQGDYLRWVYGGYHCKWSYGYYPAEDAYYTTITYTMKYHSTAAQEAELTAALEPVMTSFGFTAQTPEYTKVKTIYDYICKNITYDYTNLNDDTYMLKYTAYAALVNRTAVCQGYAVLLYRMLWEAGIPNRVVTGKGNGGDHAWNIVQIGTRYYDVDSTWDAPRAAANYPYSYFLRCEANFDDHVRDDEYNTETFHAAHPMSSVDYDAHSYTARNVAPTCTEPGGIRYTCSHCGDTYLEAHTAALGHKAVIDRAVAATYTATGLTQGAHCSECGVVLVKQNVVPKRTMETVSITKTNPHLTGNILYWNAAADAKFYQIFRRTSGKSFEFLVNTGGTAYKDETAEPGVAYIYAIKAHNGSVKSPNYSNTVTMMRPQLGKVKISSTIAHKTGNILYWDNVTGASFYQVFRRAPGEVNTWIANVGGNGYKDTTAKPGVKYTYVMKAANGSYRSPVYSDSVVLTRPAS